MARPSMPNRTRISRAIRTIACPSCNLRCGDLVRVFSTVNRIRSDDDVVADYLLDDRGDRLERVPERDLDRLVAGCRGDVVAAGAEVGRRVAAQAATRAVGRAGAGGGRAGGGSPTRVGGRHGGGGLGGAGVRA